MEESFQRSKEVLHKQYLFPLLKLNPLNKIHQLYASNVGQQINIRLVSYILINIDKKINIL